MNTRYFTRFISGLLLAAGIASVPIGINAQTSKKLTASKSNDYALIYSLPTTVIDITLVAELTKTTPGEFNNYARLHLGLENVVRRDGFEADLTGAFINTRGISQNKDRWAAKMKSGSSPFIMLDENNCILSINEEAPAPEAAPELPVSKPAPPTPLQTEAAKQAVTQEMTRSSSLAKKAELASQRIFELREMRSDLISGQAENTPPDGKSLQIALDNISAQEEALTAMFAGTSAVATEVETFNFIPDSMGVSNYVIARISPTDGFVSSNNLSGEPIYLNLKVIDKGQLPLSDKGEPLSFPKGGLAYNIPGTALVSVVFRGKTIASKEVKLSQLGMTFGLDPAMFTDKKAPATAVFDPKTGALVTLDVLE